MTRAVTRPSAVAVIPARGGSKGVPGKNLRSIAGRTLLERAVHAARSAASIDAVAVSTDAADIAAAAHELDVTVVDRPPELAGDTASTPPVVTHALDALDRDFDVVVLLQPPAPLRTGSDIDAVVAMLAADQALASVVSVYDVGDAHPGRMYDLADGVLRPLHPDLERMRRQDLPPVYHRNGALYATRVEALRRTGELMIAPTGAYVMDAAWTVNIDIPADLPVADVVVAAWDAEHADA